MKSIYLKSIVTLCLFSSLSMASGPRECLYFYQMDTSIANKTGIAERLAMELAKRSSENKHFVSLEFVDKETKKLSDSLEIMIVDLRKQGSEERISASLGLSKTLLDSVNTNIHELNTELSRTGPRGSKAISLVESLKVCASKFSGCEVTLKDSIMDAQEKLQRASNIANLIFEVVQELRLIRDPDLQIIVQNKIDYFDRMLGLVQKYHELVSLQVKLSAEHLSEFPKTKLDLMGLEMRGVELGVFDNWAKRSESVVPVKKVGEPFSRAEEINVLLNKFPVSVSGGTLVKKMKMIPDDKLATSFEEYLRKLGDKLENSEFGKYNNGSKYSMVDLTFFSTETYNFHKFQKTETRSIEVLKGFSLAEVNELLEIALKAFEKRPSIVLTSAPYYYSEKGVQILMGTEYRSDNSTLVFSGSLGNNIGGLMWSLLSRLNHPLSHSDFDLFANYFYHRVSSIVDRPIQEYEQKQTEINNRHQVAVQEHDVVFGKDAGFSKTLNTAANFFMLPGLSKFKAANSKLELASKTRDNDLHELYKAFRPFLEMKNDLENWESKKAKVFELFIMGQAQEAPSYSDGRHFYPLTEPLFD